MEDHTPHVTYVEAFTIGAVFALTMSFIVWIPAILAAALADESLYLLVAPAIALLGGLMGVVDKAFSLSDNPHDGL